MSKTNLAYKEVTLKRQETKPKISKVKSKTKEIKPAVVIVAIVSIAALLGYMVFSMVELNHITSEINNTNQQIRILKSDKVRLGSELDSKMSLSNIEKYAKNNLKLSKLTPGQVTYMNLSQGNSIVIPEESNENPIQSILNSIQRFFSYFTN